MKLSAYGSPAPLVFAG